MAIGVNTNTFSLNAQRNLNRLQSPLQTAMQRLSSGLRINSAKDDAAGLAISNRMTAQIQGLNQAVRNANDGISVAQTGEAALMEITDNLQRMRELAVQSRNATNTDSDREFINSEFQQLLAENDRLARTTAFNGKNILDGSFGIGVFQMGANVNETISVDISSSMRASAIGTYAVKTYSLATDGTPTDGDTWDLTGNDLMTINGKVIAAAADNANGAGDGSALSIAAAINANTDDHGVTATAKAATNTATAANIAGFAWDTDALAGDTYALTINGTLVLTQTHGQAPRTASELTSAINTYSATTGVVAKTNNDGSMTLTAADGRNIEIAEKFTIADGTPQSDGAGYFGTSAQNPANTYYEISKGELELKAARDINITFTAAGQAADVERLFGLADATGSNNTLAQNLDASHISDITNADMAIYRIDQAIKDVDELRGAFGATQKRFESTIASLEATAENVSAARSRIMDADFAAETANLTKLMIIQQAGISVLAQAKSIPQNVLALLQG